MARVKYTTPNTRLTFEFDVQGIKQAFEQIGNIQEVFEHPCCGLCSSDVIRCNVREFNSGGRAGKYFEMVCQKCTARLNIHQNKDNVGLYVPMTDKNGQELPNGGWYIYDGSQGGSRQDHGGFNGGHSQSGQGGGGYGNQQASSPGGQQPRSQMTDDEKRFIDLLNTKGYTYAEGVGKIAQADGLQIGPNTPFAQIPRQNLIRFVTWLKSQPDAGSQTMDGADTDSIPF